MNNNLLSHEKNQFSMFDAALATLLFVVFNVVFMEVYVSVVRSIGFISNFGLIVAQFLVEALFGVAAYVVAVVGRKNILKAAGIDKKLNLNLFVYSALVSFCCLIFFSRLTSSFMELLALVGYTSSSYSIPLSSFLSYLGYVVAMCITPAICEELLFRGVIQSGLKKLGKWVSIIFASFIFMLMHGGPEQTIHQFLIGVIVGLMFYETGNIKLSVIVHFFNNFISLTQMYLINTMFPNMGESAGEVVQISMQEALVSFVTNLFIAILFAAVGFILVRILLKMIKKENDRINGTNASALEGEQVVLVDGKEVETEVVVTAEGETAENIEQKQNEKPVSKDSKIATIICFAIPIGWMILEWFLALIAGFGG